MTKRRTVLVAATGISAGAALAACSSADASPRWNSAGTGAGDSAAPNASGSASADTGDAATDADITITPEAGAKSISPASGVQITTTAGTLDSCSVTAGGKTVAGTLADDKKSWKTTGKLSFGTTYTVTVAATNGSKQGTKTASFTTVTPAKKVTITLQANALTALKSGGTYGMGQPLIVNFSKAPSDRSAAVKALDVTIDPPVDIRWRWTDANTVMGRPEKYWAKGTKITINAKLYGVNLGKGAYGSENESASFTIGPAHLAVADSKTKVMKVYVDGALVKSWPCDMGKGGTTKGSSGETIDFWTRSGPHVLLTKEAQHRMTSASYGISNKNDPNFYDEVIDLCCRISYSGEFTHAAPWDHALGRINSSHGCIHLSTASARWIYDNFRLGDIVDVKNTPKTLPSWDGLGLWNISYSQW
jgi:lipoprotein-anchoring transpeptidase ErfK/SrfK